MIAEGKDGEGILDEFVAKYGTAVLAVPPDSGCNRLAWMIPYMLAIVALVTIVLSARRWSRPAPATSTGAMADDPEINARLDDELRNLD